MIESPTPHYMRTQTALRKAARKKLWNYLDDESEVSDIATRDGFDLVGFGSECVVVAAAFPRGKLIRDCWKDSNADDTVIALDYNEMQNPVEAKKLFYAHRIMSTLFPHNFPRFRITYGAHRLNHKASGSQRERLRATPKGVNVNLGYRYLDTFTQFPFNKVKSAIAQLEIPFSFDDAGCNFMRCRDGGVYYVDKIILLGLDKFQKDKIREYMREKEYGDLEINIVLKSIDRMEQLGQQSTALSRLAKIAISFFSRLSQ